MQVVSSFECIPNTGAARKLATAYSSERVEAARLLRKSFFPETSPLLYRVALCVRSDTSAPSCERLGSETDLIKLKARGRRTSTSSEQRALNLHLLQCQLGSLQAEAATD